MNANQDRPTKEELQAFAQGRLDAARAAQVAAYVEAHPECWAEIEAAPDDELVSHLRGAKQVPQPPNRSLLELAIEAVVPVVAGCAGAMAGGVEGGLAGVVVGQVAEKAINVFGVRIVNRWLDWLRRQPPAAQVAAVVELADAPPEVARSRAAAVLARLAPEASPADREAASAYVAAIPRAARRSILSGGGERAVVPTVSVDDSASLLRLLPACLPPYDAPCGLPGTKYHLEGLIGTGGFGAVYAATNAEMQHLKVAVKFCLDRSLVPVLERERANLDRLTAAGQWSPRIVRLHGYDLGHATPYLVYEYVAGGDLASWLERRPRPTPAEVLAIVTQVTEALAFAHGRGLVHRDLKPANVLMGEGGVKLADFGIGGVAAHAAQASRVGTVSSDQLKPAEQMSLFRGAGTPIYMDAEQREGRSPHPRHDLHSLGVMWYQLLVGDVRREMPKGWQRELERKYEVPREHLELIERCVGWIEDRPEDAGELLKLLPGRETPVPESNRKVEKAASPDSVGAAILPAVQPPTSVPSGKTEAEAWIETTKANTVEGYERFLREWPAGSLLAEARSRLCSRLREQLCKNLTNTDLRRRYLASRTATQQEADYCPESGTIQVGVGVACLLVGGLLFKDGTIAVPGLIVVGVLGAVAYFGLRAYYDDPIARELGPLPPGTPRDLDAARRYLLGDDKPT